MESNKKILKLGLIIITLSIILSLGFAMAIKLDNPVFLKNYVEYPVFKEQESKRNYVVENLWIRYITNLNDNRKIVNISFKEEPDLILTTSDMGFYGDSFPWFHNDNRSKIYGRYSIKTLYMQVNLDSVGEFDEIQLKNAKILFDNGDVLNVDIGSIVFYNYSNKDGYLESLGGGSSSDGSGDTRFKVLEDINLIKMDSPLLDKIKDYITINVGNTDYLDIEGKKFSKGNYFSINYKHNLSKDLVERYTLYRIGSKLYFKDEDGNIHNRRLFDMVHHDPYDFNFLGILKYLRARGEI